jgi:hypothetical protein
MLTAVDLKTQIQNDYAVETEIFLLYIQILMARDFSLSTVVLNKDTITPVNSINISGSPMSTNGEYYTVWQGTTTNNQFTVEMNKVIDYYKKLGYTINRKSDDMETLYWQINW